MEDLGDQHRPARLGPIDQALISEEAHGLALIHHANTGQTDELRWLPRVDRDYIRRHLAKFWEPAWETATADPSFRQEFGWAIEAVENAAARMADEIAQVAEDQECLALIHGDINPSNVLIAGGTPRFIDWQAAAYGPFYLDLPHHFYIPSLAEEYRRARASLGDNIPGDRFAAGYRVAARYIGLRYIWWTLEVWREDRSEARWVQYYLDLVMG